MTTYTWDGSSADWTATTGWNPVGVPGTGDVAILGAASLQMSVSATDQVLGPNLPSGRVERRRPRTDTLDRNAPHRLPRQRRGKMSGRRGGNPAAVANRVSRRGAGGRDRSPPPGHCRGRVDAGWAAVPFDAPLFATGWHASEQALRWSNGSATLRADNRSQSEP